MLLLGAAVMLCRPLLQSLYNILRQISYDQLSHRGYPEPSRQQR